MALIMAKTRSGNDLHPCQHRTVDLLASVVVALRGEGTKVHHEKDGICDHFTICDHQKQSCCCTQAKRVAAMLVDPGCVVVCEVALYLVRGTYVPQDTSTLPPG